MPVLALVACLALALVAAVPTANAAYPDLRARDAAAWEALRPELARIRADHPRMFMDEDGIAQVKRRTETAERTEETYGWLVEWADAGHHYTNLWATGNQLIAASIAYRLSGDADHLAFAVRIADYLAAAEGDSWTYPRIAKGLAFGYDWLRDDLTQEQRTRYGEAAVRNAKACYDTWRHSDFNNHLYLEYGPILYVGIALYGEGVDDDAAEQFALDGVYLLKHHMMPAHELVTQGDGGWHESMSYHAFFTYELAHQIEAWQTATGDDLWSDFNGLDGEGAFQLYCTRPYDDSWISVADIGDRDSFSEANASYLSLTHRRRRDAVAGHWVERLRAEAQRRKQEGGRHVRDGSAWWSYVLWHDPSAPVATPADLPTARLFRGLGFASMRADWAPEATFATFFCQPTWHGGHQHADNNSFVIHRNGLLAVDSGVYDATEHRGNYYARSIAHNTVTVTDPNEVFGGATWGGGRPGAGANDGGQMYVGGADLVTDVGPETAFARAEILAYESGEELTYVVGDATASYAPGKVVEFTRAFLFVRPSTFVVFDRVESADPTHVKRWLLHSATEPRVSDGAFVIGNEVSELMVRTLAPAAARMDVVGGEGREFEVNGRNYPPTKRYDPDEAGRWRVEISPEAAVARDYFLHVLTVDGAGAEATVREDADTLTAVVRDDTGEWAVTFTKEGELTATVSRDGGAGNERITRVLRQRVAQ
jgi:hypothetical protein